MNKELKERLEKCLGEVDKIFSGHASEAKEARDLLDWASETGVEMDDIESELRSILSGSTRDHIDEQVERLRSAESYL